MKRFRSTNVEVPNSNSISCSNAGSPGSIRGALEEDGKVSS